MRSPNVGSIHKGVRHQLGRLREPRRRQHRQLQGRVVPWRSSKGHGGWGYEGKEGVKQFPKALNHPPVTGTILNETSACSDPHLLLLPFPRQLANVPLINESEFNHEVWYSSLNLLVDKRYNKNALVPSTQVDPYVSTNQCSHGPVAKRPSDWMPSIYLCDLWSLKHLAGVMLWRRLAFHEAHISLLLIHCSRCFLHLYLCYSV